MTRRTPIVNNADQRSPWRAISTMIERPTHDAFQELAEREGKSKSAKTRELIEEFVELRSNTNNKREREHERTEAASEN